MRRDSLRDFLYASKIIKNDHMALSVINGTEAPKFSKQAESSNNYKTERVI